MNFIIESEQRVGSRWMHYLLSDLYGKRPSPEIDGRTLMWHNYEKEAHIKNLFEENRIPKIHHMHVDDIFYSVTPVNYKVLTVVRNPRDRAVSVAFHHKHDPGKAEWPQRGMSDEDAVKYTVMEYDRYNISNTRMLSNMKYKASTRSSLDKEGLLHMWVAYEWLLEDPIREITTITEWLCIDPVMSVKDAVDLHSFEKKAQRKQGEEKRNDVWRRKGVNNDWTDWFTPEMIERTMKYMNLYQSKLEIEQN